MLKQAYIGDITFDEGTIDITDPCYDHDVWCRLNRKEIVPGNYQIHVFKNAEGRVAKLRISLKGDSDLDQRIARNRSWRTIGFIGVDVGLAGFFQNKPNFSDKEWLQFCDELSTQDHAKQISDMSRHVYTYTNEQLLAKGIFSSTGYGDGEYPVYAISRVDHNKRRAVALEIRFL